MSINKEILESIRQIHASLAETLADAEKNDAPAFYKESIKLSALHIFEKAQLLSNSPKPETTKPAHELKIIRQDVNEADSGSEKISLKSEPVIIPPEQKPIVEPIIEIQKVIEPQQEKQNIIKPQIETQKVPSTKTPPINNEDENDTSLNAKIAKYQQPVINVADKMKDTPIKELVKAISISKKFEFINELFAGKAEVYKASLHAIESSNSYGEAAKYIENNIAATYNWSDNETLAAEFFTLIKRRFL